MKKLTLLLIALCALAVSFAAEVTVPGSVLFQAGVSKISGDDLKAIIYAGSQVEHYNADTGSVRRWTNEANGKFVASRQGGTGNAMSQGNGEWKVTDSGVYCVVIEWRTRKGGPDFTENWCRVLYRHDGEYYLAPADLAANVEKKYSIIRFK